MFIDNTAMDLNHDMIHKLSEMDPHSTTMIASIFFLKKESPSAVNRFEGLKVFFRTKHMYLV